MMYKSRRMHCHKTLRKGRQTQDWHQQGHRSPATLASNFTRLPHQVKGNPGHRAVGAPIKNEECVVGESLLLKPQMS